MQNNMKNNGCIVALTGGIGSGKSYALSVLEDMGYRTVSCDAVYAEIFEKNWYKRKLKKLFPTAVKGFINLKADRKEISKIVFADKEMLLKLNELSHPIIVNECIKKAKKYGGTVFVEVPLLFEGGFESLFDKVVVIKRDLNKRIESVMDRSSLTEEEVLLRIRNQTDYETKDLSQYIVVENDENFKQSLADVAKSI
ncbi:MAG: dephospho-CoA kinase [Clostridiales bacterium]|nr:dephospho-CoA kinase [Clostridiales bacterium]